MPGVFGVRNERDIVTFNQLINNIIHNPRETLVLPNRTILIGQLLTLGIINYINGQGPNYNDDSIFRLRHVTWSENFVFIDDFNNFMSLYF